MIGSSPLPRPLLRVLAAGALVGLVAAPAAALDVARRLSQFPLDQWQTEQGLPQNTVGGICETPDGYLWLATQEGLVRFDGVAFAVYNRATTPSIPGNRIHALACDADGSVWIGTAGFGLLRLRAGSATLLGATAGLPSPFVSVLAPAASGGLWIGTWGGGVARLERGAVRALRPAPPLPDALVVALAEDRAGALWVATQDGSLSRLAGERLESVALPGTAHAPRVEQILADGEGGVWFASSDQGLFHRRPDGGFERLTRADGLDSDGVTALFEDRERCLWAGTAAGSLVRLRCGAPDRLHPAGATSSARVAAFHEDPGGNLWVGYDGAGLFRLGDGRFTTFSTTEGLSADYVTGLREDRAGGLWVATQGGGVDRLEGDRVRAFGAADGLEGTAQWSVLEARDGAIWVGGENGLFRRDGERFRRFVPRSGPTPGAVYVLAETRDGALWAGTNGQGLLRIDGERVEAFGAAAGLTNPVVHVLLEDSRSALWAGTEGGLARLEGGRLREYGAGDGLPAGLVIALAEDPEGRLWVGTTDGLAVGRDGRFRTLTAADGLYDEFVFQILFDDRGDVWMSSNRGVFRTARAQVLEVVAGQRRRVTGTAYGRADGMKSPECNGGFQPAGVRLHDGRLCFPTIRGLVFVDPARPEPAAAVPTPVIETLTVGGRELPAAGGIALPLGVRQCRFGFTGLGHHAAELTAFRVRLEGLDDEWRDVGRRRSVEYTNLRPGRYLFQVAAAAPGGAWSPPATLALSVPPRFHETGLFRAAVAAVLLLGVAAAVRGRLRGLERRQRQLAAEVARRTDELQVANRALAERGGELEEANRRLARLSAEDPLTGLANRRRFDERLEQEWRRAERAGAPLALLLVDVDFFKEYNDAYGHPQGDLCLQRVGALLAQSFGRAGDLPARIGGDEFGVVLADTARAELDALAGRLRAAIAEAAIPHRASRVGPAVSLTVGAAAARPGPGFDAEDLRRAADEALYRAKAEGRDRACSLALGGGE